MLRRCTEVQRIAYHHLEDGFSFNARLGFNTQSLAYTLNSLVRVSRRVE